MSLQEAINSLPENAPTGSGDLKNYKDAGHLIRPQDWNSMVNVLREFGAALGSQQIDLETVKIKVSALESQLATVAAQAEALDARVDTLAQQIEPLLDNYRVTLSCSKINYALGEICELTAKVTDLSGEPLQAPFPWVDFVAAWGRLRAKPGFTTLGGAADNSLSVQVNALGIAQVQLRNDHAETSSDSDDLQISNMMQMQIADMNISLTEAILTAPTPNDVRAKSAYQTLHLEYDRKDSQVMRRYTDSYQASKAALGKMEITPNYWNQWRDYRATIIALAKPDSNPTTPDGARGSASIQITFRDWLYHWSQDYLADIKSLEERVFEEYSPFFSAEKPYEKFENAFTAEYRDRGLLGQMKYTQATYQAMARINPGPQSYQQEAKQQIRYALGAQVATEAAASGRAQSEALVMQAHVGQSKGAESVQQQIVQISQDVEQSKTVGAAVSVLEGRMQSAERVGQSLHSSLTLINDNVRAINPLDENSLKANVVKISAEIAALKSQFNR